jgi:chromate transporter
MDAPRQPLEDDRTQPGLPEIGAMFARYGNLTFGGGSATIAVLREQILTRRKWVTELQFQLAYALSRLTPGTNLLAFSTAIGWIGRRWAGAIVALAAASLPCSAIAILATHFFEVWQQNVGFRAALRGALAAAVAVMINTAWVLAHPHLKGASAIARGLVVVPAAIALTTVLPLSPFQVLMLAAVVGLLWPVPSEAKA